MEVCIVANIAKGCSAIVGNLEAI
ncbi:uncharacterized protein G2W53_010398 [Senna tora]|uniref:Uncharacterized protein n=1 Tax=Senna tora TaxID=362788 RepID=A0A834WZP9_9FABA|nr:uncharacterized protein G2W53_010337 [Senna tora]KAF7835539.1 uncharacterized protein G2W53_010398 [Senna tora]